MLRTIYRPIALADIDAIADYTKARWGEGQAKRYVADLRAQIERAAEFPAIGSAVYGLPDGLRKVRSGSHRAVYRTTATELVVIRILHEREDVPHDIDDLR